MIGHFSNTLSSVPRLVFLLLGHVLSVASLVTDCWYTILSMRVY